MAKKATKTVAPIQGSFFQEGSTDLSFQLPSIAGENLLPTDRFYGSQELYLRNYEVLRRLIMEKKAFFIPGDVPSAKNSKRILEIYTGKSTCCNSTYTKTPSKTGTIFTCHRCGNKTRPAKRPIIANSEAAERYKEEKKIMYDSIGYDFVTAVKGRPLPVILGMFFIRSRNQDFDFNNASQIVQDMLVEAKILPDDNCNYCLPLPLGVIYGKSVPGVILFPRSIEMAIPTFTVEDHASV